MAHLLQIGSGALGLGLVCALARSRGLTVTLANRTSEHSSGRNESLRKRKSFNLLVPGKSWATPVLNKIRIDDFLYTDADRDALLNLARSGSVDIVTTSAKRSGVLDQIEFLFEFLFAHITADHSGKIYVIACENEIDSSFVKKELEKIAATRSIDVSFAKVSFVNCVVDRICNKPIISNGDLSVTCEKHVDWILQSTDDRLIKFLQRPDGQISFVRDLEKYITRKKWIVNAGHLLTALYSHFYKYPLVNDFCNRDEKGIEIFEGIFEEIEEMFLHWNDSNHKPFQSKDIVNYINQTKYRLRTHPQTVRDSTTRLKKPLMTEFLTDYHRKIGSNYIRYFEATGQRMTFVPYCLNLISETVAKDNYP